MPQKPRITTVLPNQIMEVIEKRSVALEVSKSEFAADVIKWWFSQGSPAVTQHDEFLHHDSIAAAKDEANSKRLLPKKKG